MIIDQTAHLQCTPEGCTALNILERESCPAKNYTLALKLLEVAKCPACDGSGAYYEGSDEDPQVVQCQWCDERGKVLKALPPTPST